MVRVNVWMDGRIIHETFSAEKWEVWQKRFDKLGITYQVIS